MRLLLAGASALIAVAAGGCGQEELDVGWAEETGRSLEVTYSHGGGQNLGDVDVAEHEDQVIVTLRDDCFVGCDIDDAQFFHCVTVELEEPLGLRQVIDGSTGHPAASRPPGRPRPDVPCEPPP
jgi:hypothetical protein